jgi:hypothetical protein
MLQLHHHPEQQTQVVVVVEVVVRHSWYKMVHKGVLELL